MASRSRMPTEDSASEGCSVLLASVVIGSSLETSPLLPLTGDSGVSRASLPVILSLCKISTHCLLNCGAKWLGLYLCLLGSKTFCAASGGLTAVEKAAGEPMADSERRVKSASIFDSYSIFSEFTACWKKSRLFAAAKKSRRGKLFFSFHVM